MNCPTCHTANPEDARFCLHCGTALALTCPLCSTLLPAAAKFCFNCGHQMAPPAEQATLAPAMQRPPRPAAEAPANAAVRLQQFIPSELLAKLQTVQSSGSMEGERRVVTMLFCDVSGSTAAASHLDPEEWAEIINGAFEHMIAPIYAYEGTVARLMGDGILAFFGAPIAHEDDPQRAVLAGLDIVGAIAPYRHAVHRRWGIDFGVRVGINTGLVVVGAVGSDLRMEYTALGDAINLAARMEQTATPGTVQIAESTYKLIAPLFDVEVLERVAIKGKDEPVRAYRVIQTKAEPGRLRGIAGLHSPLIGRAQESSALWDAVSALQQGRGQIVSVLGEAGLGKSRLIAEVRAAATVDPTLQLRWIEGRSLSYQAAVPFALIADLLGDAFGLRPQQDDNARYRQILAQCEEFFPGRGGEVATFLSTLLNLPLEPADEDLVKYLEPPQLRGLIFMHVTALIEQMASQMPLVLVLDDLHWVDPTSLELLEAMLPLTKQAPLLIIAAFRPRQQEISWRFHESAQRNHADGYMAVPLQPLNQEQARELVASLLHVEDLPERVRRLILEKSEGNPFFVEEVIRSLLERNLVVREGGHWHATREIVDIAVPDTLVGVITARLDRLDDGARQIVQTAAVLGRQFNYATLAGLLNAVNGELENGLADLVRRQLLRDKSETADRVYSFKHVLTQEAAYNTILLSRRRQLHHRAAEALEQHEPERAAEIARHFLEARQPGRAVPHLVDAGDRAARNYAAPEAIEFFTRALSLQAALESLEPVRRAYEGLGNVLALTNQPMQALETYQAMLELAEGRGDRAMQISALNKLAGIYALHLGRFGDAERLLARTQPLIQEANETGGAAEAALIRCRMCTAQGDFEGVVAHMGNLMVRAQRTGSKEYLAMSLEHLAFSQVLLTRYDEAWATGQQALAAARDVGDRLHEASVLTSTLPLCLLRQGELDTACDLTTEGLEIARRINAVFPLVYGNWILGEIHRWRGEYEQALHFNHLALETSLPYEQYMPFLTVQPLGALGSTYLEISPVFVDSIAEFHRHALRLLESPMTTMGGGTAWADLGWCAMALGDMAIANESFAKGMNYPSMFSLLEKPRYLAGSALLASHDGRLDAALRLAEEACAYAEERRMRHLYPLVRLVSGHVQAACGAHEAAVSQYQRSAKLAAAMNMRPVLWQAEVAAARSLEALGSHAAAAEKRQAARTVIEESAAAFADEALRTAFRVNALAKV